MTLEDIRDLFLTITDKCYHYKAWEESDQYVVWAEDNQVGGMYSDNKTKIQVLEGTIDLYTKVEYDPIFDTVQEVLNSSELSWRYNSTQFEEETGFIHHEWIWQVGDVIG